MRKYIDRREPDLYLAVRRNGKILESKWMVVGDNIDEHTWYENTEEQLAEDVAYQDLKLIYCDEFKTYSELLSSD